MIKVVSRRTIKPAHLEEMIEVYNHVVNETRKEPGCIVYELFQDIDDPNTLVLVENWDSLEALDGHTKTQHYIDLMNHLIFKQKSNDIRFMKQLR